ncbi:hypothetical protein NQZ68_009011 [Dissostichus eleginoides]|nr:hypothetical protein NQZ68_009011 [Dissostichus eleginoides]
MATTTEPQREGKREKLKDAFVDSGSSRDRHEWHPNSIKLVSSAPIASLTPLSDRKTVITFSELPLDRDPILCTLEGGSQDGTVAVGSRVQMYLCVCAEVRQRETEGKGK